MTETADVRLYGRVQSMTDTAVVLEYALDNVTGVDIVVCNRLYRQRLPDGRYVIDPDLAYVSVEPGPRPDVSKRVLERGDDVHVEYPVQPFATLLRPGERLSEQFTLALPLYAVDAYHPVHERPLGTPIASQGLTLSLGWFPHARLGELIVEAETTAGRLPMVKASWVAQSIATVAIDASVPVLAPQPDLGLRRQCTTCGAVNAGEQANCLRCGTPLPAPTAPAGPGWQPTHRVPPNGMASWVSPGGQPSDQLDGGLPVQVVETYGDWARVVAWTGWTGWVDGRLLEPGR
jgi:hypothetical protein